MKSVQQVVQAYHARGSKM